MLILNKIRPPFQRSDLVPRPRLVERLHSGTSRKLTLLSAPAGFGKSTAVVDWLENCQRVAWLSLDPGDNDPSQFWRYLIASIRTVIPHLSESVDAVLGSTAEPSWEPVVGRLVNELTGLQRAGFAEQEPMYVVLDDYHQIKCEAIHASMNQFLDYLPRLVHPVIITRCDPDLRLACRRAAMELDEVRVDELRFSNPEIAQLVNGVMDLGLCPDEIDALEARTEGWIAGLQLAGISLRSQANRKERIADLCDTSRYIFDYLMDEVIACQEPMVQEFLYKSSVLDRMCGSLCGAILQGVDNSGSDSEANAQRMLEFLERSNLFLVALDGNHQWYRYHSLFAELLRKRLQEKYPNLTADLHRRAGHWYEVRGSLNEALAHILATGDEDWAGVLVEKQGEKVFWRDGELSTLHYWFKQLPMEVFARRSRLSLLRGWVKYVGGHVGDAWNACRCAESQLCSPKPEYLADQEWERQLDELAAIKCLTTCAAGQSDCLQAIREAESVLDALPSERRISRMKLTVALAESQFIRGNSIACGLLFKQARELTWTENCEYAALWCMVRLFESFLMQGLLHEAVRGCRQMRKLLADRGCDSGLFHAAVNNQMAEVLREWNDLDAAEELLRAGIPVIAKSSNLRLLLAAHVSLARLLLGRGDSSGVRASLSRIEKIVKDYQIQETWCHTHIDVFQARLRLAIGDVSWVVQWAGQLGLNPGDEIAFGLENAYLVYARLLLAQNRAEGAFEMLERLQYSASSGGRGSRVMEALALQALALDDMNAPDRAMRRLQQCLELSEPNGFIRLYADEGPRMAVLLQRLATLSGGSKHIARILAAFVDGGRGAATELNEFRTRGAVLTRREIEILQLLARGLSNKEIANELDLSPSTVKVHARNIYAKLKVGRRTQAIARGREVGLLT